MKALLIGFPDDSACVIAILLIWLYPISRERAEATQRQARRNRA